MPRTNSFHSITIRRPTGVHEAGRRTGVWHHPVEACASFFWGGRVIKIPPKVRRPRSSAFPVVSLKFSPARQRWLYCKDQRQTQWAEYFWGRGNIIFAIAVCDLQRYCRNGSMAHKPNGRYETAIREMVPTGNGEDNKRQYQIVVVWCVLFPLGGISSSQKCCNPITSFLFLSITFFMRTPLNGVPSERKTKLIHCHG